MVVTEIWMIMHTIHNSHRLALITALIVMHHQGKIIFIAVICNLLIRVADEIHILVCTKWNLLFLSISYNKIFCFHCRIALRWREWFTWSLSWATYWQWRAHETSATFIHVLWRKPWVWIFYTKLENTTCNQRNYRLNALHCPMCIVF